jgi:hypothetical protein
MDPIEVLNKLVGNPEARQILLQEVIEPLRRKGVEIKASPDASSLYAEDPRVKELFDVAEDTIVIATEGTFERGIPEAVKRSRAWKRRSNQGVENENENLPPTA